MSNALPVALGSNGVRPAPCAVRWTFVVLALTGWWAFAGGAWAGQDDDLTLDDLIDAVVQGDYEDAEEIVEEIPSSAERYLWHARLLRETGRSAKARELLAGAPAKIQEDPRVQTRLGGLLVECGQWKEAEQVLGDALLGFSKTAPDRVEALARLGLLQKSMGKTKEARRTLQDVVAFYQKLSSQEARSLSPQLYVWMGKACEGLNRYRDAYEVMYSSAFDVEGEHVTAHVASGNILLEKYNYPDARSHFKDGIKENPDFAEAHIGLAKATYVDFQYPRNRFIDTLRALKAADRIWKDHPETLRLRGDLAFFDENWIDAEDYYRRAIASCPPNLTYQAQLGVVFYATHRLEELTALEAEVAKLHPKPAEFYSAMAAKLVDRFFYEESANFARKAVELDPDYWPAYVTLGVNALRVGKDEEGREFINKAFEHDKFNVWAFNTRVLNRHIDKNFVETKTGDFTFRLHREDRPFLLPYLRPLMESAKKRMEAQYEVTLSKPIVFEDFSKHTYFSARSIGLPGLAASGVCFGKLVTLTTPKAIPGNWGSVAIHEFGHVVALHKAKQRVPRWLTEGLSVFEEGRDDPHWVRHYPDEFAEGVFYDGLLPIGQLQSGFTKPDSPGRILLSYYQGGVICRYITENYGFDKIVAMLGKYGEGKLTEPIFREVLDISLEEFDEGFFAYAREFAESFGIQPRIPLGKVDEFKYYAEDNPEEIDGLVRLGFAYYFNGRETDAELAAGRAKRLEKPSADLQALLGLIKLAQGRAQPVVRHLQAALDQGTKYKYRSLVGIGTVHYSRNNMEKAIDFLQPAIELHPTGTRRRFGSRESPYYMLINAYLELERSEDALRVMEKLVDIDRDDRTARMRLLRHYVEKEEWAKALRYAEDIVFIDPYEPTFHDQLAQAYLGLDRFAECQRELEILLATPEPNLERISADLAWCYHQGGKREKAVEWARKALEFDPEEPRAREILDAK